MKKFTVRQLAQTALLLAICIISQFFKNFSPYITGPIVNAVLIIATLTAGIYSGLAISIIAPVTAFFITGSPLIAAVPLILPLTMAGNALLVCAAAYAKPGKFPLAVLLIIGSIIKAAFLCITIVWIVLPAYGPGIADRLPNSNALPAVLAAARITFSLTQLLTALAGSLIAWMVWLPLQKYLSKA